MSEGQAPIGWIGCGRMGTAMVTRLLDADQRVAVTNRTREKAVALADAGASVADRPVDLAGCSIVFVMVSADADVLNVIAGPSGVLADPASAPSIVVDCSTVSVEASAEARAACAKRNARFLAAPVSGNPKVVEAGRLSFIVSGEREAFDEARPILHHIGPGVTYAGEGEVARLVKICHNMVLGVLTQSLAEVAVLAESGGVRRSALLEFLNNSVLGSTFTKYKAPALVSLDFTPTFTTRLLRKDFDLGMAAARAGGVPMPLAALCTELVAGAVGAGYGDSDFAALLAEEARSAGIALTSDDERTDGALFSDGEG